MTEFLVRLLENGTLVAIASALVCFGLAVAHKPFGASRRRVIWLNITGLLSVVAIIMSATGATQVSLRGIGGLLLVVSGFCLIVVGFAYIALKRCRARIPPLLGYVYGIAGSLAWTVGWKLLEALPLSVSDITDRVEEGYLMSAVAMHSLVGAVLTHLVQAGRKKEVGIGPRA